MSKENKEQRVWKYFKIGDIVVDSEDSVWGKTKFEVIGFHGNEYCPLLSTFVFGKMSPNGRKRRCNLDVREVKLLSAHKRPFRNMANNNLTKLLRKGNVEAKREFLMRINTKK